MSTFQSTSLFVGDLSIYCTESDLQKLFSPFGPIEAIRVKKGGADKLNLAYGFVKFHRREHAEKAMNMMNGHVLLGRALKIGWADRHSSNKAPKPAGNKPETAQIHVSFVSKQVEFLISEATLRGLFGLYGEVVDVSLKKSQFDRSLGVQNGYGFVHYKLTTEGIRSAVTAVKSLDQVTVDCVAYDCSVSHELQRIIANMKQQSRQQSAVGSRSFDSYSLPGSLASSSMDSNGSPFSAYSVEEEYRVTPHFIHSNSPVEANMIPTQFNMAADNSYGMHFSQPNSGFSSRSFSNSMDSLDSFGSPNQIQNNIYLAPSPTTVNSVFFKAFQQQQQSPSNPYYIQNSLSSFGYNRDGIAASGSNSPFESFENQFSSTTAIPANNFAFTETPSIFN